MSQRPPATPGMALIEVDTPALIIDLDAFERNLRRMAGVTAAAGVRLRPHAKTHKSPVIGLKQMTLGAVGVCCQKVSEAEAMVDGGILDVLISNEVVGSRKLERLAALAKRARIQVVIDDAVAVQQLQSAVERVDAQVGVLVEINVGGNRCGVEPGAPAVALARLIESSPNLRFCGLQAYHGRAQHFRTHVERVAAIEQAVAKARETIAMLKASGFECETVGGAGTGTFEIEAASGVYNELQAGSYCFMDADYARNKIADGRPFDTFEHALFVYATVMSVAASERAIVDAGLKALSFDSGPPNVPGVPGALFERPSDEHGCLNLSATNERVQFGDKVLLIPGHCDPTVNLHDWYVGVRGIATATPHVEAVWPVAARGAIF